MMINILNSFPLKFSCVLKAREISLEKAKEVIFDEEITSFVGHESTAKVLSELLKREVDFRRAFATEEELRKNFSLVFVLDTRLEEGKILSREELEKLNYKFLLVKVS